MLCDQSFWCQFSVFIFFDIFCTNTVFWISVISVFLFVDISSQLQTNNKSQVFDFLISFRYKQTNLKLALIPLEKHVRNAQNGSCRNMWEEVWPKARSENKANDSITNSRIGLMWEFSSPTITFFAFWNSVPRLDPLFFWAGPQRSHAGRHGPSGGPGDREGQGAVWLFGSGRLEPWTVRIMLNS